MSPKQIAQELLCDFQASGETFLQSDDIEFLRGWIKPPLERWGPGMNVWTWKYPLKEHKYIVSADVSRGDAADYSAFHVIDTNTSEVVDHFSTPAEGDDQPDRQTQTARRTETQADRLAVRLIPRRTETQTD